MNLIEDKDYQRQYLRAPYTQRVLYSDEGFVFHAKSLNLSEGGILMDEIPHFPEVGNSSPLMLAIPSYPYFKNFTLEKLREHSNDLLNLTIIKVRGEVVRKQGIESRAYQTFLNRVGISFLNLSSKDQQTINKYVDVFASNLIYLQVLLDNLESNKDNLDKFRLISKYLGYDCKQKIALLSKTIQFDYKSLQWL
jgi:hypothetical protein